MILFRPCVVAALPGARSLCYEPSVLDYLRVRGLALLDDVALEFDPGMNVLTGETGAGKSIIVDALTMLRGSRARAELVRDGEDAARVEAQFTVRGAIGRQLRPILDRLAIELEDETLVLERHLRRSARGRIAIQSSLSTLASLAEIGSELVEICSQHEHHSLTHVTHHLELLDAFAELDGGLGDYADHYRRWHALAQRIVDIRERETERLQRADYLRFQIEELERVSPEAGEYDQLRSRMAMLRRTHELAGFATTAQAQLYDNDDAIASQLAVLLDRARRLDPVGLGLAALVDVAEQLDAAKIACEEAASAAARLVDELEVGPGELELAHERLHELERLRRKHGCEVDELLARLELMRDELVTLDSTEDELAVLEQQEAELWRACSERADRLHDARVGAAEGLARAIERELDALHIPTARLAVELHPLDTTSDTNVAEVAGQLDHVGRAKLGPRGRDRAELRFSANPGEPLASLSKVASGGELSRVLLAVKSVLSTQQRVSTYVFDEVDAGVGGAVAESIGLRLRRAASNNQVLCITHLPQIAAYADAHFRVHKQVLDGRTVTRVERLDDDARIEELARMLGGKRVTRSAREHARELIEQARKSTRQKPRRRTA
jgi:DNA repair protein RecN (Recombination protein N)